ncbi:MAG: hypothetical protein NVSMB54_07070 [Ktedonobacteraceae bacterium]
MRMRWWQSIRWRLAFGSILVVLLATTILALATIFAIAYYYNTEQTQNVHTLAADDAQQVGEQYATTKATFIHPGRLGTSLANVLKANHQSVVNNTLLRTPRGEEYQFLVFNGRGRAIYPPLKYISTIPILPRILDATTHNCNVSASDVQKVCQAIMQAKINQSTTNQIGQNLFLPRTFTVEPITIDGTHNATVIGVLVMLTPENTISTPFVSSVAQAVLLVSLAVALIAAVLAVIFSRTITRPLAKLTNASRIMASGDYNAQVTINSHGEIGELAHSFNEMAAQLSRDVDELRQQELWRRELIMSITHDLATPLTAIAGLGESLVDGVTQSRDEYEATGRIIVRETLRLRRLVKDLHVMAKVEAGALQPQRKELRLAALVDEVLAVLAPEFERAEVEPRNAIPYQMLIQADADMLMRVFSNLCANAIRHTPAGGSVTIEARPQGDMLLVSVSDTGEGIPPEAISLIFERFYRADNARQSATGGSGLGLAIVRAIVEAHGGTVHAENNPSGARIVFTLPLSDEKKRKSIEINARGSNSFHPKMGTDENTLIAETIADTISFHSSPIFRRNELLPLPPQT